MKITSLIENTTDNPSMLTEHGLSLFIEVGGKAILFDTGQSDAFIQNAKTLGIDLAKVDFAVISHGHYDHGGGLPHFLSVNKTSRVYINEDAFLPHYNGDNKYIGLPQDIQRDRIVFTKDSHTLCENITLFTCNGKPRNHCFGAFGLKEKVGDEFIPDDFRHEQYLLIEENNKRILISGCSHKGIIDIVDWFNPHTIIGGFHFSKISDKKILSDAAQALNLYDTDFFTCHCTGKEQFDFMKNQMERLNYFSCGMSVTV